MIKVYGIPNCNTVKKALDWLKSHDIKYEFHDYKKLGITAEKLHTWTNYFGWENVLNKKGTTWSALSAEEKESINNEDAAIKLMLTKTSIIKRPIVEVGDKLLMRFDVGEYEKALHSA